MSTPLARILLRRIAATGPITLADYMTEALLHPDHGYYATRDPFGASGDFTTAPEISQMFGELIGLTLAQAWIDQGRPDRFVLAELGPGRGTLMADILRAGTQVPGFIDAATVHLIEASPVLRAAQAARLCDVTPIWHSTADTLPDAPLYLIANEFFDALPIRQFQRGDTGWRERVIGAQGDALTLGLSGLTDHPDLDARNGDTTAGDIVEICPAAVSITQDIARRIGQHGGAALIIDYGGWHSLGDTLQAVKDHAPTDPFSLPGTADLTAHVDFEALARAAIDTASGLWVSPLTPQGVFLERLGITARAKALANAMTESPGTGAERTLVRSEAPSPAQQLGNAARESHIAAHRRLTHPEEMGTIFKVLGLAPPHATPIAGLSA